MPIDFKILWDKIWKDKKGKIVIWQWPNAVLWGWLGFAVLAHRVHAKIWSSRLGLAGTTFLLLWACLELFTGVNYFRRGLGLLILLVIILGFFSSVVI